jgi:hypothetical protein
MVLMPCRTKTDITLLEQAYGNYEGASKALEDSDYFLKTGKHLPVLNYPTRPDLPKSAYPDVTNSVVNWLNIIVILARAKEPDLFNWIFSLYFEIFRNNGIADLQVGHGLPGQVLVWDSSGNPIRSPKNPGRYLTTDQYAAFQGKVHRAGYISNYASAAADLPKEYAMLIAQSVAVSGNLLNFKLEWDNSNDQQAISDGWDEWHRLAK